MLYQWLLKRLGVMSIGGDEGPGEPAPAADPVPAAEPEPAEPSDEDIINNLVKGVTGEDPEEKGSDQDPEPGSDPKPEPKPGDKKPVAPKPSADEIDLGEAGKAKREDVLTWKKSHESYTQKAQELSAQQEKLKPIIDFSNALRGNKNLTQAVIMMSEGAFGENGYNEEYIGNLMTAMESLKVGKPVAAPAAAPEASDDILEQMKQLDIDPDAAYGKLFLKMHGLLKSSTQQIEALNKQLEGVNRERQDAKEQQVKDAQQQTAAQAKNAIDTAFGKLTDGETKLDFDSDDERTVWHQMVTRKLAENNAAGKYKTIDEVTADVEAIGREQYKVLQGISEARTAKVLKGVNDKPQTPQRANHAPVEDKKKPVTMDTLEETIMAELRQMQSAGQ